MHSIACILYTNNDIGEGGGSSSPHLISFYIWWYCTPERWTDFLKVRQLVWSASPGKPLSPGQCVHVNPHNLLVEFPLCQYHVMRTVDSQRQGSTCLICSSNPKVRATRGKILPLVYDQVLRNQFHTRSYTVLALHLWRLKITNIKNANYSDPSNSKFGKI